MTTLRDNAQAHLMRLETAVAPVELAQPNQASITLDDFDRLLDYTDFCVLHDTRGQNANLAFLCLKGPQEAVASNGSIAVHISRDVGEPSFEKSVLLGFESLPLLRAMAEETTLTYKERDGKALFTAANHSWSAQGVLRSSLEMPLGTSPYPNLTSLFQRPHKNAISVEVTALKAILEAEQNKICTTSTPLIELTVGNNKVTVRREYLEGVLSAVEEKDIYICEVCEDNCPDCQEPSECSHEVEISLTGKNNGTLSIVAVDHETGFEVRYLIMPTVSPCLHLRLL